MKKTILFVLLFVFAGVFCFSQQSNPKQGTIVVKKPKEAVVAEQEVFTIVEQMPQFPGGDQALQQYIRLNIRYPRESMEKGISGTVFVTFVVNSDGRLRDVKVLRGVPGGKDCDMEALRVVNAMGSWVPGRQNGKNVPVQYNLPIRFVLK